MKHVTSISIDGFRGFRHPATVQLAVPDGSHASGLTVLTGPNNAGKSSVLEVLRTVGSRGQPTFGRPHRNSIVNDVSIEYLFEDGQRSTLKSAGPGSYVADWSPGPGPPLPGKVLNVPAAKDVTPFFGKSGLSRAQYSFESTELKAVRNETVGLHRLLTMIAEDRPLKERFDSEVTELLGFKVPWDLDQIENRSFVFTIEARTGTHTSDGIGHGVLSVFHLVAGLMEGSEIEIVSIDEPEVSLNPQVQRRVANYIADRSAQVQIIMSTHSPYFVDPTWFGGKAELVRCYVEGDTTKLGRLSPASKARIHRLSSDLNNPHMFGLDAREIFFATGDRRVLVVEGQEDVVILRRLLTGWDRSLDLEIFGWGAGGAPKIPLIVALLKDLGINDVATLVDRDQRQLHRRLQRERPDLVHEILPTDDIRDKRPGKASRGKSGLCTASGTLKPEHKGEFRALAARLGGATAVSAPTSKKPRYRRMGAAPSLLIRRPKRYGRRPRRLLRR